MSYCVEWIPASLGDKFAGMTNGSQGRLEKMRRFHLPVYIPEFVYWMAVRLVLMDRRIRYGYSFRKIPLTQGKFAIVDEEDYDELNKYKWYATNQRGQFYAGRTEKKNGRRWNTTMHRQIMNCPMDKVVDHKNHNGLDNRKANLRLATRQQNSWNIRKWRGKKSSQFKGVSFCKRDKRWEAYIILGKKHIFIGRFDDEETAARAYDKKAKELFGEFANPNFADSGK
jgi:hypothetical protein